MPRYIVTGSYTASAMKAMVENPSDREAAARSLVEAAGGTLESFYLTTGDNDFSIKVTIDDATDLISGLMATGASGAVSNLKTIRAFTSDEFTAMQTKAGEIAKAYKAPGS
ncbi:GYD domain-containing protein [Parasedimentitalea psychrophila]|uniref:GYD domain-containing protein n=1 Tax=Parasedimentitalea psychrophila TaxID=2997337 RepID=A0A9Y2P054_9RHOB|nr:GYD domain-containing protein [Parasedimentitalea psychrophila]WIY24256.1 GYD domain-containing protein [Parasedimentitalea psychrophila]